MNLFNRSTKQRHMNQSYKIKKIIIYTRIGSIVYHIYQPLRSGRIWHKVNF